MPTVRLANRYQSTVTGDFCDELILSKDAALPNGARNRASYENRDWRMKSTIMWDGESYKKITTDGLTMGDEYTWMFGERNEANGFINNDASNQTGYIFRKWIRQEAGWERTDGPQDFYLMRLADVYLMYAEAVNETSGPTSECVALLNKIRSRGNLPALTPDKYANSEAFFNAIEQERIVELATEGMRPFDIRRWRKIHDIWGEANSDGLTLYDTNGTRIRDDFKNAPELNYKKNRMKNLYKILTLVIVCLLSQSCNDYPVDDNGLLVTDSEECYISSLILRGPDDRDVLISGVTIDDENNTITGIAKFGTNIKKLKPECGTAKDCIVTPTMGVWTDFSQPRQYTVISGNRQVKKTYTVTITLQGE